MLSVTLLFTVFMLMGLFLAYRNRYAKPMIWTGARNFAVATAAITIVVAGSLPSYASLELNIDVQPLFDSIGIYLPIFFAILAIGGGITIAMTIGKMIIKMIAEAFQ